jgi:uncharacterized protein
MATVTNGDFEWDADKASENLSKHAVSFVEALTVLLSDEVLFDADFSDPSRTIVIGFSSHARVLFVVTTETTDRTRIISARRASPAQCQAFAQAFPKR